MTSESKQGKKTKAALNDPAMQELNSRLDHIYSKINPPTPYILTVPSKWPYQFEYRITQQMWVRNTPFSQAEAELQYLSNFGDWDRTLIAPLGGWDDGKGGIASKQPPPPPSPSKSSTPMSTPNQPPKKVLKLGDYAAKKKASAETPAQAMPSSSAKAVTGDGTVRRSEKAATVANPQKTTSAAAAQTIPTKKQPRDETHPPTKSSSTSAPPQKKLRVSPVRMEEPKPTLPPPMTPLPPKLAEAVAEYRRRSKNQSEAPKPADPKPPVTSHPSLVITFKFRKKKREFERQVKAARSKPSSAGLSSHASLSTRPTTPAGTSVTSQSLASQPETPAMPRVHSPESMRPSVNAGTNARSRQRGKMEHAYWTLALRQKDRSEELRKAKPMESLAIFIESIITFMVHNSLQDILNREEGTEQSAPGRSWIELRQLFERARHFTKKHQFERLEGLLWHLEAVICTEIARSVREPSECHRMLGDAASCAAETVSRLNPLMIAQEFSRTWYGQASRPGKKEDKETANKALDGEYVLPFSSGTSLMAARAARLILIEWCEKKGVDFQDELGKTGGVKQAS